LKNCFNYILLLAAGLLTLPSFGQNEADVLRYSFRENQGTARSIGMGGAMGALGGDLSAIAWNPAGLGQYRRGEIGFNIGIAGNSSTGTYNDRETSSSNFAAHIPNAGLVLANGQEGGDLRFLNYAIVFNKVANFNSRVQVSGPSISSSLTNVFVNQANGTPEDQLLEAFPFTAGLGWDTFLIDPIPDTPNLYESAIPFGPIQQERTVESSGHFSETLIAVGGNYLDRLYFGATLGFPNVNFSQTITYREFDTPTGVNLNNFTYREDLVITGNGLNIKLGATFRALPWMLLGAAYHSRTTLSLNDVWDVGLSSQFKTGESYQSDLQGAFNYRIQTPRRYIGSAAFLLGPSGVISADYEFINYTQGRLFEANFGSNGYDFEAENAAVSRLLRPAHNVRIGGEWRINKAFRARGGVQYQQSAFTLEALPVASPLVTYSLGAGYRSTKFYADAALRLGFENDQVYFYDPALVNPAQIESTLTEFVLSAGIRF
jgi:hypothetical protein